MTDQLVSWEQTGLPLSVLAGRVARAKPEDVRGGPIEGVLHVYVDWRLQKLQAAHGVPVTKLADVDE
jgi:hypothetical protein